MLARRCVADLAADDQLMMKLLPLLMLRKLFRGGNGAGVLAEETIDGEGATALRARRGRVGVAGLSRNGGGRRAVHSRRQLRQRGPAPRQNPLRDGGGSGGEGGRVPTSSQRRRVTLM